MAKIIFYTVPGHGHINPILMLLKKLVQKGNTVICYSTEKFEKEIKSMGCIFRNYGKDFPCDLSVENIVNIANMLMETSLYVLEGTLEEIKQEKPDCIIHDMLAVWGKYASRICGVTSIDSVSTLVMKDENLTPGFLFHSFLQMFCNIPGLLKFRKLAKIHEKKYGTKNFGMIDIYTNWEDLNIIYTSRYFQPGADYYPGEKYIFVGPCLGCRHDDTEFEFDKLKNKFVIYMSFGTILNRKPKSMKLYKFFIDALGNTDKVVVIPGINDETKKRLGAIPDNFIMKEHVPQLRVLEYVKLFITHGSFNSVSEGLYYKVPLLIIPQTVEEEFIAKSVENAGGGIVLHNSQLNVSRIQKIIDFIAGNKTMAEKIALISDSFHDPEGLDLAVKQIMSYV